MTSIKLVYGDNFVNDSLSDNINQLINIFATNLANKEFNLTINNSKLWKDDNIPINLIEKLMETTQKYNEKMRLTHVNKKSKFINMFPILISGPVEYFVLTDIEEKVFYSIFITPEKISVL